MKNKSETLSMNTEIRKSVCLFCLYGCDLLVNEINRGDFILRKIDYDTNSAINQGRLCARGNMATEMLNSGKRLTYPLLNNKNISWSDAFRQITSSVKSIRADSIAITYDTNNTLEEITSIFSFAQELKTDNVARSYLHPEQFLSYSLNGVKNAELKDIEDGKVFLIIGDVFGKSPVIAKPILDAKYADRNNRLYYIDSVKTKLAGFANKFIHTKPNTEPLVILALVAVMNKPAKDLLDDKQFNQIRELLPKISEICGISVNDITEIAQVLSSTTQSVILTAIDFGKTQDPLLLSLSAQLLALSTQSKKFCAPALASVPLGKIGFNNVIEQINQGKVKTLINFGDNFPAYYPQLNEYLSKLDLLIHTATFRNASASQITGRNYTLPIPLDLEKSGTVNTLWLRQNQKPLANMIKGTKLTADIIDSIMPNASSKTKPKLIFKSNVNIEDVVNRAINFINTYQTADELILLGEESAFGYLGIFEDNADVLKINPLTAQKLNVRPDDSVILNTAHKEKSFKVKIVNYLKENTLAISVNTPKHRNLFPMRMDKLTDEIIIGSTYANVKNIK